MLVACAFTFLPLAIMAMRNIAPFSLLAVPAASHLLGPGFRLRAPKPADANDAGGEHPIINLAILAVMAIATIALVALDYLTGDKDLGWQPIDQRALAAVRACDGPLYNHYDQGGYLIWFVPEKPVFVDGRQDPYPLEHVLAARRRRTREGALPPAVRSLGHPLRVSARRVADRQGAGSRRLDDPLPRRQVHRAVRAARPLTDRRVSLRPHCRARRCFRSENIVAT